MVDDEGLEALGQVFARSAKGAYRGHSPLYQALAKGVSEDRDLLQIASSARRPPVPNLLFAAVHYLLLSSAAGSLSSFYHSLTREPRPPCDAYPHFREFCLAHEAEIRGLMATRLVQTNEVGRCSYLLPAFALIARETPGSALSLIDVGASAGLNLLWDRYAYVYADRIRAGITSSSVRIETEVRGKRQPPIPQEFPAVAFRIGIDLSPVDLTDAGSALWLRALVWPEHEGRAAQLEAAIALAVDDPPVLVGGDAVDVLPRVLDRVSHGSTLCIFHNHALNQVSPDDRRKFDAIVEECSSVMDVYLLSAEGRWGQTFTTLELVTLRDGVRSSRELAKVDHDGGWLEWTA